MKQVRTRFAPSPTGFLHIGGLRTALYCYAWAKKQNGSFVLRIEDTDQNRLVEGAVEQIIESMAWAGITADEGVVGSTDGQLEQKGDHGPYVQSERLALYKKFAQELLEAGKAYKCYCSPERLDTMREVQRAAKQMPKYDRHCYHLSKQELQQNEGKDFVIRFYVPEGAEVSWDDTIFEAMSFERDQVDDFILLKADDFPTYNFANVIDDHLMNISHVIRGQEFLSSTPKHLLLYEAFEWEKPEFVHVPWILGKNKQKLSKRLDDVSVQDYREKGILPEALVNYLALLGWNPKDDTELFSLSTFIEKFDLKDIQKSGAVFDTEKLLWMNGQYLRELPLEEFAAMAIPYLEDAGMIKEQKDGEYKNLLTETPLSTEMVHKLLATEQPRVKALQELPDKVRFFFVSKLEYDPQILAWKKTPLEEVKPVLESAREALSSLDSWGREEVRTALMELVESTQKKVGEIFWPVRVALTGLEASPGPDEVAEVIGKEATLDRLDQAIKKL